MATVKEWVREYWYLGLVAAAVGLFFWWQGRQPNEAPVAEPLVASMSSVNSVAGSAAATSSAPPKKGYVHIKGAVAKPGVYPVGPTTRWVDVVALAGGLVAQADVSTVNLAQVAVDQESLYIPKVGEETPAAAMPATGGPAAAGASSSAGALVNLNTATEAELQTLSGIGPKKAADIIAYRDQNGGFKAVEDLKNVSGIGDKTFERLAPLVTVGP
ncbi:helix-hairpin-helix domain-containing protein [Lacticaseibacillus hegangensis]|uniref:Helix-hairpin-helix domain-containing protein n=1 Tax=Lacticaseibacillus hegangensis TaxID=2486010 RepID=A0ABW4CYI1_9LACO|nr:helix-hairpin-helix domain-containing protein [Lacticaseibacillus hegangensis]